MKLITVIIQPGKLDAVKKKLFDADIHKMTVSKVRGCGQQKGYNESYRGQIHSINLLEKIKIEIAVNDNFVKPTVEAIIKAAQTNTIGDGKIFVTTLDECYRIRTNETGPEAIG
ncbi:MAG: P-II family nitrogen regulator [Elusimicrobiota bacterium]